jgi:hypothetical protein
MNFEYEALGPVSCAHTDDREGLLSPSRYHG